MPTFKKKKCFWLHKYIWVKTFFFSLIIYNFVVEKTKLFLRVFVGTVGETFFLAPWIYLSKKTFFFFIDHRKPDFFLRIFVGTVGTSRVILSPHSLNVDAKNKTKKKHACLLLLLFERKPCIPWLQLAPRFSKWNKSPKCWLQIFFIWWWCDVLYISYWKIR